MRGHFHRKRPPEKLKIDPQMPSMLTGMMGTSMPLTMRSKPRRNGQHLADARDLAFGKNADDFAVAQRFGCFAQRMNHFARTLVRRDRDDVQESSRSA